MRSTQCPPWCISSITCLVVRPTACSFMTNTRFIKTLLLAASSMTVMAGAIISPALPDIDLHFAEQSDVMIKLVLTMPALMITLFGAPMGMLADRFGKIRLLTAALLLYGIAGTVGGMVDNFTILLISRAGLGIAVAGIMSISTTLIGDYFQADERMKFLGTQASFMALGGVLFLNLGGVLAEWSWRGPFLLYLSGLVLAPLCLKALYEPARHKPSAVAHSDTAVPDTSHRLKIALAYFLGLMGMLLFYMVPAQLPFLLNAEFGSSSSTIGMLVSVVTLTGAFISFHYGKVRRRISIIGLYISSYVLAAIGFCIMGLANGFGILLVGLVICGIGFGVIIPNGNVWLMTITPPQVRGRVIGGFSSVIFLGQFLSPIVVAPMQRWLGSLGLVFVAAGIASLVLGLLLLPLLRNSD